MAEVSIDSMVTPEKDELDEGSTSKSSVGIQDSLSTGQKGELDEGSTSKSSAVNQVSMSSGRSTNASHRHRRLSVGSNHAGASSLRNSAEKSESTNSSKNVVPHYLRASTGSCHDLCKFGRAHSSEIIIRKPFLRKRVKPLDNELCPVQILVPGGKKKEVVSDGKKMEEVVSGGLKAEEVVSGGLKAEEVVSGGLKAEEVVSGGLKAEEVVSGGQMAEEVASIGQKKQAVANREPPTDIKDHLADQKPSPDTKSSHAKPKISKTSLDKEKATKHKGSTLTNSHSPNVPSSHNKSNLRKPNFSTKAYSSKQNDSSGKKTLLPVYKPSSAKKSPSADPPEIVKSVYFPYTVEDSVKQGSLIDNKISKTVKKIGNEAIQRSSPVKLKSVKVVKSSFSSNDSDGMLVKGSRSNNNFQTGRKVMTSKASAKKIITPPSATLTSKLSLNKTAQVKSVKPGNLKLLSPLKDRSRTLRVNNKASNGGKVAEKTLHVIGVDHVIVNSVSESIPGDNAIPSSTSPPSAKSLVNGESSSLSSNEVTSESEESAVEVDSVTENNDSMETGKNAPVKENHSKTVRKSRVVVPEDKQASAVKVKFRMGKVVDLQSDNNNTPRRLRFRRARVIGAEDSKSGRKNLKKAGVNGDTTGTGDSSQKVVLKHQAVQGKKDDQGLLNNVIEQTASKLVESRKSKVKALVGAFETVISLQETKPSTQVVN